MKIEYKEDKKCNKGGRPKKGTTEKLTYRIAVKMSAAYYFRLLTQKYDAGVLLSEIFDTSKGVFFCRELRLRNGISSISNIADAETNKEVAEILE